MTRPRRRDVDFQRHHLILLALLAQPQMVMMFGALKSEGFCLSDFPRAMD